MSFKLDIDHPDTEIPIALSLLEDPKLATIVDEFFFELHFRLHLLLPPSHFPSVSHLHSHYLSLIIFSMIFLCSLCPSQSCAQSFPLYLSSPFSTLLSLFSLPPVCPSPLNNLHHLFNHLTFLRIFNSLMSIDLCAISPLLPLAPICSSLFLHRCGVMTSCGWGKRVPEQSHGMKLDRPTVLKYFIDLRRKGIRAHIWP